MLLLVFYAIRYGVVANIIASHAIARGSIPRVGIFVSFVGLHLIYLRLLLLVLVVPACAHDCSALLSGAGRVQYVCCRQFARAFYRHKTKAEVTTKLSITIAIELPTSYLARALPAKNLGTSPYGRLSNHT